MEAPTAPAAPPQPAPTDSAAPSAISAVEAAISKSPADYRAAKREAKRAELSGKPLPSVPVEAAPAPPAEPAAPKHIKLTQDEINERTRRAVEASTADLRAEIDRLKRTTAPAEPVAQPQAPPPVAPEKFPSLDVWAEKNPGKTFDDYLDARDDFRAEQTAKAQKVEQEFKTRSEELTKRGQAFAARVEAGKQADPDFANKIPPAMRDPKQSIPLSALSADQLKTATFSNLVAEAAFRSEQPIELLKYLHSNQAEAVRIAGIAAERGTVEALIALERIDERIAAKSAAPPPPLASPKPKKITSAPAPQETLGNRPADLVDPETAAIKAGTAAYRQFKREQRASQLIGRR